MAENSVPRLRRKCPSTSGVECCVFGCNNRLGKDRESGEKRKYHTLPKDPTLRKKWLDAIPRSKWQPKYWHRVCSDHFVGGKKTSKQGTPGYVPHIFPGKEEKSFRSRRSNTSTSAGKLEDITTFPTHQPKSSHTVKRKSSTTTVTTAVWQTTDHDYVASKKMPVTNTDVLNQRIFELEEENRLLKHQIFSLDNLKKNDDDFKFYTNFPNYEVFKAVCNYLQDRSGGQLKYWRGTETLSHNHFGFATTDRVKPGPNRKLSFDEEFFLLLVRMKTGNSSRDTADRFGVDQSLVSRVLTTWSNFLDMEMRLLFEMTDDDENVADCYKSMPDLKVVVDCTEQQCEKSSDLQARKETFSNYKQRDTFKWLIGLSRNLTINYVSSGYGGRASDKHITLDSSTLIDNLPPGSSVMADRGFLVTEELKKLGVRLIIPDFKGRDRSQMTRKECENSEFISAARIHIERIIQRLRTFHMFDTSARLSMKDIYDQMFRCCAYLCNFQLPIIRANERSSDRRVLLDVPV